MVLGLLLRRALYFVIAFLQLVDVCLVINLWASDLAFLPIVVISSTQVCKSVEVVGKGGILGVWSACSDIMSGSLGRCARGYWHVARMAFRMVWCSFRSRFHFFCYVLGRKPLWFLTLLGRGGVGFVIQVYSIHSLRELMIS